MEEKSNDFAEIGLVYKIDDDDELQTEKVRAIKIGKYYQMKAIPRFAKNVAYNDIIAVEQADDGLWFEDLITPSGHSVVHIVLFKPDAFSNLYSKLVAACVNIEWVHKNTYLAVDVPSNILYTDLKRILDEEFVLGNIDFSEACLSERHR